MSNNHALTLKVMRLSPFFLNNSALTEHAAASPLSLEPSKTSLLSSHPSTLRDFSVTDVLTLPATFGTIQLGETFTGSICVNNDSYHPAIEATSVSLRVEMQTSTNKIVMSDSTSNPQPVLRPPEFFETVVHHEIKELGQHVLACTVTYRIPPALAQSYPVPPDDPLDPTLRIIRKFYKFMVTNPLSVKTKVQVPKAPNALLMPSEASKVFLEVDVQNLTSQPMTFTRMYFDYIEGWSVDESVNEGVYEGSMGPGDVRQYLYILSPIENGPFSTPPVPGTTLPLGRLDIAWTTSFGEPGRLLTSVLSRRVPAPMPPPSASMPPPSSLPPHLQQQRPQSPQLPSLPNQPPSRPASPFKVRVRPQSSSVSSVTSPQVRSPTPTPLSGQGVHSPMPMRLPTSSAIPTSPELEAKLILRSLPAHDSVRVHHPFKVGYTLRLSSTSSSSTSPLSVAIQHLENPRPKPLPAPPQPGSGLPTASSTPIDSSTPTSAMTPTSASPTGTPVRGHFTFGSLSGWGETNVNASTSTIAAPSRPATPVAAAAAAGDGKTENSISGRARAKSAGLPPPLFSSGTSAEDPSVVYTGRSLVQAPRLELVPLSAPSTVGVEGDTEGLEKRVGGECTWDFELEWMPLKEGVVKLGGLRALVLESGDGEREGEEARMIGEWNVVGEVWVGKV